MVNGILLRKFEEQIELIQTILITYLKPTENLIQTKQIKSTFAEKTIRENPSIMIFFSFYIFQQKKIKY